MPAFSMKLLEPQAGDPAVAARIRADAAAYLRPLGAGEAEGRRRVGEYRRLLAERNGEAGSPDAERKPGGAAPQEPGGQDQGGRDPRSKQERPEDGSGEGEE